MQTYTRTLLRGFQQDASIHLTVCAWKGPTVLLPFFVMYACFRAVFFSGDGCHIGDALLSPIASCIRFFRPRLRLTLTTYGLDVIYPSRHYQWMLRRTLPLFDVIVTISHATALKLLKRSVDEKRMTTIVPGVDIPLHVPTRRVSMHQFLILGRQIKRKGTLWFLRDVMPKVLRHFPDAHLIIAGDGPELLSIRALVSSMHLDDHVTVLGMIDAQMKEHLLSTSQVMIVPNIAVPHDMEGFGLVCTEALLHGLPVVASRREGLIDAVVEGETGMFFESQDPDACLRAMQEACVRVWDTARMRQILLDRYSSQQMCSQYRTRVF